MFAPALQARRRLQNRQKRNSKCRINKEQKAHTLRMKKLTTICMFILIFLNLNFFPQGNVDGTSPDDWLIRSFYLPWIDLKVNCLHRIL
jgi:hypothetical protein